MPTRRNQIVLQPTSREVISGPNTRWLPSDDLNFPIERLAGSDAGLVGAPLGQLDPAILSAVGGSEEYATPVSRAKGQLIRLIPFTAAWLVLSVGVVWVLGLTAPYFLLMFALLTAATYLRLNLDEFRYSRNGLERDRVDSAVEVRMDQAEKAHELKKMALVAYLEIARAQYGVGTPINDNAITITGGKNDKPTR